MFGTIFQSENQKRDVFGLYDVIVKQSRLEVFYQQFEVPDTIDGRFDMITLHMFLVLYRLQQAEEQEEFAQALFDAMFTDMDRSLRERGIGDLSVPKHIKRMMRGFYGRLTAYEEGITDETDQMLKQALKRNLYGDKEVAEDALNMMAAYMRRSFEALQATDIAKIHSAHPGFIVPDHLANAA